MKIIKLWTYFATLALSTMAILPAEIGAQSLTPEEIERLLDEQLSQQNPYAALLNDPDPQRSLGAIRIMMESGDPELITLATEFGLLSADRRVQRAALEYYLDTNPRLAVRFDLSEETGNRVANFLDNYRATMNPEKQAFTVWHVGDYDKDKKCFVWKGEENCMFILNANGIFIEGGNTKAQVGLTPEGNLVGFASLGWIDKQDIPIEIKLIE